MHENCIFWREIVRLAHSIDRAFIKNGLSHIAAVRYNSVVATVQVF